jgi:hypothetical protein
MEDVMKALMESASAKQKPQQTAGGGDALSQMLGGMLGGQQQSGMGGGMLGQALGGLLGTQQSGSGAGTGALLGGLQQIIGGTPGTGQQLPMGGGGMGMTASNPMMSLLQPIVNQVAEKLGISPQTATVIASIALHYLVQSSPNTPGASPLNLGSVMQTLAAGRNVSPSALQKSGMVDDVIQATGMDKKEAVKSLNTTFSVLGGPVKGTRGGAARRRAARKR